MIPLLETLCFFLFAARVRLSNTFMVVAPLPITEETLN